MAVYAYLLGDIFLGLVWVICYVRYKKLRDEQLFGSILYPAILIPLFLLSRALSLFIPVAWRYVPDYFNPDSLFDLSRITGGLAIEDALFMFFAGGLIAVVYETIFTQRVDAKHHACHHVASLIVFFVAYLFIASTSAMNPIYNLIISSLIGFLLIAVQRRDLIKHAIYGAIAFTVFYTAMGVLFLAFFSSLIPDFWNRAVLSDSTIFQFPFEEVLYAFSFGLMWAPMYEYVKGRMIKRD